MIIVRPMTVDEAALVASNIDETDGPAWDAETTFAANDHVIYAHHVYESLIDDNTGNQPDTGVATDPPSWLDLGATNRYRMFDKAPSAASQRTGVIDVTVQPNLPVNAVGLINLSGLEVLVQVLDAELGVVYEQTQSLQDVGLIADWHDYFFSPFERRNDVVFLDLPTTDSPIRIVINAGSGVARCGEIAIGRQDFIGTALYSTSLGIRDYSRKETDDFGNTALVQRGYSKTADIPIVLDTTRMASVQRALARVRAEPSLYVGDGGYEETILYGFYRGFTLVIAGPIESTGSVEIESLTYEGDDALFDGALISMPQITSPTFDEALPENGIVRASVFATLPEGGDTQIEADWQFATDAAFTSIAHESLADTTNLDQYPIPTGSLTVGTSYYVRVLYRGSTYGDSAWSAAVRFIAGATAEMVTPSIVTPADAASWSISKPIAGSAFTTDPASVDEHYASDWQIADEVTFASPLYESLGDHTNLSSLPQPDLIEIGETYYVRVRYVGRKTGVSSWSAAHSYIAAASVGQILFDVPGTYTWTVPRLVTSISGVAVGAGGAALGYSGGGGGELRYSNGIAVTPGQTLIVYIPVPGVGNNQSATLRYMTPSGPSSPVIGAACGYYATGGSPALSGQYHGDAGGYGGDGGSGGYSSLNNGYIQGGGGGAGGYGDYSGHDGQGGTGGRLVTNSIIAGTAGVGGAAGGGGAGLAVGYGGGGVGVLGAGASGAASASTGRGGSGGSSTSSRTGGAYGGGAAVGGQPGGAAVRIIWGIGREYPATNTGDA